MDSPPNETKKNYVFRRVNFPSGMRFSMNECENRNFEEFLRRQMKRALVKLLRGKGRMEASGTFLRIATVFSVKVYHTSRELHVRICSAGRVVACATTNCVFGSRILFSYICVKSLSAGQERKKSCKTAHDMRRGRLSHGPKKSTTRHAPQHRGLSTCCARAIDSFLGAMFGSAAIFRTSDTARPPMASPVEAAPTHAWYTERSQTGGAGMTRSFGVLAALFYTCSAVVAVVETGRSCDYCCFSF